MSNDDKRYETARTRELRQKDLSKYESGLLDTVEKFGCMVLHVKEPDEPRPSFSYTVGLYNARCIPELITCGLHSEVAQSALNDAAELMAKGVSLAVGRHPDLIGNVDVEFRPVDPKWISHLMNSAVWFNGSASFPVLQLVYPDIENRFPEDEGFNTYFDQPLLQIDAPAREIEDDFWAENDPDSSLFDWKFPDPPHTGAYLSKTVHEGTESVTYVSHDADDGAWQFLGDLMSEGGGPVLVCLHHPIDKDSSLKELADLPAGWCAERKAPGEPWVRRELPPYENEEETEH